MSPARRGARPQSPAPAGGPTRRRKPAASPASTPPTEAAGDDSADVTANTGGDDRLPWLGPVAAALVEALPRLYGEPPTPLLRELIVALTEGLGRGVLELPLSGPAPAGVDPQAWPEGHRQALLGSRLGQDPDGPLVLGDDRVAWRRWHEQRESVLASLVARAARPPGWLNRSPDPGDGEPAAGPGVELPFPAGATPADAEPPGRAATSRAASAPSRGPAAGRGRRSPVRGDGAEQLSLLAGETRSLEPPLDPQQQRAVAALLQHGLVLLEGGPGTGKTSTVRHLLNALRRQRPHARIQLAAPTGKAAARLRSACDGAATSTTVHRLLESRGERFHRNRHHPLALDLLVVDEVSMLDQGLMAALLEALPETCQLVLVGDAAQLPPIAPGAVLDDLQRPALRQRLGSAAITLTHTYRNAGRIAEVAAQLRQGLADDRPPLEQLRPLLQNLGPDDNLSWLEESGSAPPEAALTAIRDHQRRLAELNRALTEAPAAERLARQRTVLRERDRLLLLTPRRRGSWGVEGLHERLLGDLLRRPRQHWPCGTPVLCCRNLPDLGLANGDLGVLIGPEDRPDERRLLFDAPDPALEPLELHPALLAGAVEPALALTVHKAQGSEAERVIVLLPGGEPEDGRLLYTALTRARQQALLITRPIASPGATAATLG